MISSRLAGDEVVPGVVAHVMGAAGLVDAEEMDTPAVGGHADAEVVAVNGTWEVGDTVGVDVTAEDADGGGIAVMRSGSDLIAGAEAGAGQKAEKCGEFHGEGCLSGLLDRNEGAGSE